MVVLLLENNRPILPITCMYVADVLSFLLIKTYTGGEMSFFTTSITYQRVFSDLLHSFTGILRVPTVTVDGTLAKSRTDRPNILHKHKAKESSDREIDILRIRKTSVMVLAAASWLWRTTRA